MCTMKSNPQKNQRVWNRRTLLPLFAIIAGVSFPIIAYANEECDHCFAVCSHELDIANAQCGNSSNPDSCYSVAFESFSNCADNCSYQSFCQ